MKICVHSHLPIFQFAKFVMHGLQYESSSTQLSIAAESLSVSKHNSPLKEPNTLLGMSLPAQVPLFAKSRSDVRQHPRLLKWIEFQINIIEQKRNSEPQVDRE